MSEGGDRKRGGEDGGKGGKKAKYFQKPSGSSASAIPTGSVGILVTCESNYEFKAAKEAVALVEEHYDKLQPAAAGAAASAASGGTKDISALLAEEVAGLKDRSKQRFRYHDTQVKGCIYVIMPTQGPTPLEVTLSVLREAQSTKVLRARHCHRWLPITHSCFCGLDEVKEMAPRVIEGHFPAEEGAECIPFAAEYEYRSSTKFDRMEVIDAFVSHIKCPPHKVNLKEPVKTILIQGTRNACGASVVTHYRELAKFNIRKLTEAEPEEKKPEEKKVEETTPQDEKPAEKVEKVEEKAEKAEKAEEEENKAAS